ncbi:MAG: hypothetical protein ACSLEL_01055 [Candidatus Malihini olakiniferum]
MSIQRANCFSSLHFSSLRLNDVALLKVLLGFIFVIIIHKLFSVLFLIILKIFSGEVTNIPSLNAGRTAYSD